MKPTSARLRKAGEAVVIGASAGGIEALSRVLAALPRRFAPAVLVVLHLRPDVPSLLAGLFAERCQLPVSEALDKAPLHGGHVYIAPPGYHLLVEAGPALALSVDPPVKFSRPSIDVLFESAAWVFRQRLLGILLTGASDDGAQGLATIRAEGGRTWVQDPVSAAHPAMPLAAIERHAPDEVLSLDTLAERLGELDLAGRGGKD
ncbi:chemotaxis protein CheB [Niveibacterium sp. SC-1]|uniref:chemotaxis protein CheB n=1 Tax=Niveibacterium sp. SC-1 TaxID=3135646 RepID=UPI00311DF31E